MNITLKKAAALAQALLAIPVTVPGALTVSVFSEGPLDLDAAIAERDTALLHARARIEAAYLMRSLIGDAPTSKLLTERAAIDKQLEVLNVVPNAPEPDLDAIRRRMAAAREDRYASKDVAIPLPFPQKAAQISALKRRRVQIEDELARINFDTTIELPVDVVALLREYDLI